MTEGEKLGEKILEQRERRVRCRAPIYCEWQGAEGGTGPIRTTKEKKHTHNSRLVYNRRMREKGATSGWGEDGQKSDIGGLKGRTVKINGSTPNHKGVGGYGGKYLH